MINFKLLYKILGSLLFLEAAFLICCLMVAVGYGESDSLAFLTTILITVCIGSALKFVGRDAENSMGRRDAYLLVTLTWIIFSVLGSLPFLISGYMDNFTNAFFETMSGFTTTGASIIDNLDDYPHGLLFWRSTTHWIGGLGIVFFTVALLPSLVGGGSVKVFAAEATGPIKSKLHPRLSTTAKWIWTVYIFLTLSCAISYWICGMGVFDAVTHSMSTTATGGFSTHGSSISYFNSPTIEWVSTFFMLVAGVNFSLIYLAFFKGGLKKLINDAEFKMYAFVVCLATSIICLMIMIERNYEFADAIRSALFQVAAFITTTGFYSDDAGAWPPITWVVLAMCMFTGSCAGSTSGGVKCVRCVMVLKVIRNQFKLIIHPKAVLPVRVGGHNIHSSATSTLLAFLALYILLIFISSVIFIFMGIEDTNAITISLSSMSNVGPALGNGIGPTGTWNCLPDAAKWLSATLMLAGRLEVFSVMVLFTPAFWKEY